jgi:enolase-phosphatase E1
MPRPALVLTDIEGTTTPISFVHDVLFPYARARLPALVAAAEQVPEVAQALLALPAGEPLATLLGWMDRDVKAAPLKYPDVAGHLRSWAAAGTSLAVYSSGSIEAQRLLFGHSDSGDLSGLFGGFYDTSSGPKREARSYHAILADQGMAVARALFLSDVEAELDAAAEAGLLTCQLVRAADDTRAGTRHPVATDFGQVAQAFGLSS